jgi:hypothetical protein
MSIRIVVAAAAESEAEIEAAIAVVAEEGDKSRSPVVAAVVRAGIPSPAEARVVEPAAVVVGSPTPRFSAHPGPAVVVDVAPASVAVGRPAIVDAGEPAFAITGHVAPAAIVIKVLRAVDATADIAVTFRLVELLVSAFVEGVPVVFRGCFGDKKLRVAAGFAAHGHALPFLESLNPFGRCDLSLSFADRDPDFTLVVNLDAIAALLAGSDRDERGFDVDVGVAAAQLAIGHQAPRDLHAELPVGEIGNVDFAVGAEPQQVRVIKLNFSARTGAGSDGISVDEGRVHGRLHPVALVAMAHRDIAVRQTDTRNSQRWTVLLKSLTLSPTGKRQGQQCNRDS